MNAGLDISAGKAVSSSGSAAAGEGRAAGSEGGKIFRADSGMTAQTHAAHDAPIPRGSNAFTCGRGAGSHSQRDRMQVGDACISESSTPRAAVCPLLKPPTHSPAGDPPSLLTLNWGRCAGDAPEPLLSACTAGHLTPGADASGGFPVPA